jgi:hypothetical protein
MPIHKGPLVKGIAASLAFQHKLNFLYFSRVCKHLGVKRREFIFSNTKHMYSSDVKFMEIDFRLVFRIVHNKIDNQTVCALILFYVDFEGMEIDMVEVKGWMKVFWSHEISTF